MDRMTDPLLDGVHHINIYTKGTTRLGRLLSNLSDIPLTHPKYGMFRTAEGFWYYLKTGRQHESLRAMSGFEAKQYGRELPTVWWGNFRKEFTEGLECKIRAHQELKELLIQSSLPFSHYYVYSGKVVEPKDSQWLIDYFTELRELLQHE